MMNFMSKAKVLRYFLLVAILAAAVTAFYYYLESRSLIKPRQYLFFPPTDRQVNDAAAIAAAPTFITKAAVVSPNLSEDGQAVWYFDKTTDNLYRQSLLRSSSISKYSLPAHDPVESALWPRFGSSFILNTSRGRFLYEASVGEFIPYSDNVVFIDWLPGRNHVAYVAKEEKGAALFTAEPNLNSFKRVAALAQASFRFAAGPDAKTFALYVPNAKENVYLVIDGIGALEKILADEIVDSVLFSPEGGQFALISLQNGGRRLQIFDLKTRLFVWPESPQVTGGLAWSADGQTIYWSDGESIKKADVASGQVADILPSGQKLAAAELMFSGDGRTLYFVEQKTRRFGQILLE